MKIKRAYKFRIYPSKNQEVKLNRILDTCRHLYNDSLAERKRQAELNRLCFAFHVFPWGSSVKPGWIDYYCQAGELADSKTPQQKEVFSQVLQDVLRRLDKNFKNFYRGFGYPRFKGRNRYDSFTYPQMGFEVQSGRIKLSKIGSIRAVTHRQIEGKIKTCTIKKDVDQWYAVFTAEVEKTFGPIEVEVEAKSAVGVDVGLTSLLTLSTGDKIAPPEFLRKSEKKLAKEQVRLSRKKRGSQNGKKQRTRVARIHRKIKNQRKDFAHKTSRILINTYDFIAFENLNIRGMVHNHHLAKSICDAGWYQLQKLTAYKAEDAGKLVEFCKANGTSQQCHVCGNIQKLMLQDRVFHCSRCGNIEDRDINASINVLNRSLNRSTAGTAGRACKSSPAGDAMKQEANPLVGW